ncbi:esterase, partial [Pseudomonas sp. GW460-13]
VECLHDNAVPIALQRSMQSHLPCRAVVTLDTDHCPFFSSPGALAEAIDDLVSSQ